jgi:hypothetical protein
MYHLAPMRYFCLGSPLIRKAAMHASGMDDERKDTGLHKDRPKAMGVGNLGCGGACGAAYALDRFSGTTLTERVLRFMERYDKSIDGREK